MGKLRGRYCSSDELEEFSGILPKEKLSKLSQRHPRSGLTRKIPEDPWWVVEGLVHHLPDQLLIAASPPIPASFNILGNQLLLHLLDFDSVNNIFDRELLKLT